MRQQAVNSPGIHRAATGAACVFGGSGGLGQAICRALVEDWDGIFLTYRSRRAQADALTGELAARSKVGSMSVDIRNFDSVATALTTAKNRFGAIGTVVFAAGVNILQPYVAQITAQQWEEVIQTELVGFTHLIRAVVPLFREQGGGTIVALGSFATHSFPPGDALSAVPKAAIEMLCRAVSREEGRHGIRANVVAPGIINAGLGAQFQETMFAPETWAGQRKRVPLKRFGEAAEIAAAVAFLASNRSSYISGQTIVVDGGLSL
jgi:NAD(P)-dependent dehydrogenase (short-subunit alcohol dehydrogenase family)